MGVTVVHRQCTNFLIDYLNKVDIFKFLLVDIAFGNFSQRHKKEKSSYTNFKA